MLWFVLWSYRWDNCNYILKRRDSCLLAKANANDEQTVELLHDVTVPNKRHVEYLWSYVLLSYCHKFSPCKGIESWPKHQRHYVQCVVILTLFIIYLFIFRSEVATIHLLMRPWLSNTSSTTSLNCFLWLVYLFTIIIKAFRKNSMFTWHMVLYWVYWVYWVIYVYTLINNNPYSVLGCYKA